MGEMISNILSGISETFSMLLPLGGDYFYFCLPFLVALSCFVIYEVLRIIVRAVYR